MIVASVHAFVPIRCVQSPCARQAPSRVYQLLAPSAFSPCCPRILPLLHVQNLSGDCTETVVLLHTVADKYRALGQSHVAAGLLRRAVLHMADPVSGSHLDAVLRARMALAEVLVEGGALEDALNQYRAVMQAKGVSGVVNLALGLKDSIRSTRLAAAAAAATLLAKLGRDLEAEQVMTIYGAGSVAHGHQHGNAGHQVAAQ